MFEVSATVGAERIRQVLGENVSIWSIGVASAHNDVMKSRRQKAEFRALVRTALDQIKTAHGQGKTFTFFLRCPFLWQWRPGAFECRRPTCRGLFMTRLIPAVDLSRL